MSRNRRQSNRHQTKTLRDFESLASEYGLKQRIRLNNTDAQKVGYKQAHTDVDLKSELDLHGYRVKSAISEIDAFLNKATLAGMGQVKIIHGKGTGALRAAVREHLENHLMVESWRPDPDYEEADGAVWVVIAK